MAAIQLTQTPEAVFTILRLLGSKNVWSASNKLTYFLTACRRVLLEKLKGLQLVKKFPAFYGTRGFITAFISARHLSLSSASSIQSTPTSHFPKIHLNIILPSTSGSPNLSLSFRFPQHFYTLLLSPYALHSPPICQQ